MGGCSWAWIIMKLTRSTIVYYLLSCTFLFGNVFERPLRLNHVLYGIFVISRRNCSNGLHFTIETRTAYIRDLVY